MIAGTLLPALVLSTHTSAVAGDPAKAGRATEIEAPFRIVAPRVDGAEAPTADLARAPWRGSAVISGFADVNASRSARRPTSAYIGWDDAAVWVALRCEGRGRSNLKTEVTQRDGPVWRDDSVEFYCDPGLTRPKYYQVVLNSAGVVYDAAGTDKGWNPDLRVATLIEDDAWTGVLRIPMAALGVKQIRDGDTWGVNFCRSD